MQNCSNLFSILRKELQRADMLKYSFLIILFVVILPIHALSAQNSNKSIQDSLFISFVDEIIRLKQIGNSDTININCVDLSFCNKLDYMLLSEKVSSKLNALLFQNPAEHKGAQLTINKFKLVLNYLSFGKDSLIREFNSDIESYFRSKSNQLYPIQPKFTSYRDTISRDELKIFDSEESRLLSKSAIPEPDLTWYEAYFEPIAITITAAVTVILFFTLRSK